MSAVFLATVEVKEKEENNKLVAQEKERNKMEDVRLVVLFQYNSVSVLW